MEIDQDDGTLGSAQVEKYKVAAGIANQVDILLYYLKSKRICVFYFSNKIHEIQKKKKKNRDIIKSLM
jgi:purine nucleoside permease